MNSHQSDYCKPIIFFKLQTTPHFRFKSLSPHLNVYLYLWGRFLLLLLWYYCRFYFKFNMCIQYLYSYIENVFFEFYLQRVFVGFKLVFLELLSIAWFYFVLYLLLLSLFHTMFVFHFVFQIKKKNDFQIMWNQGMKGLKFTRKYQFPGIK